MNSLAKTHDHFLSLNNLDHFFHNWNEFLQKDWVRHIPAVNVVKTKEGYELECAAPGLDKKDFKIDLEGDLLTISATKKTESKEEDKHYSKREYNYSSFSRSFNLPDTADREKITAKYENGILKLAIPQRADGKKVEQKINVQ
ncbi:Hsp20/alpha crystallin family protein [Leptospira sanjuanensis]|uniref:Hsp20/alpha crystallin family protein n=1 Tax=Leptospira sanjuanensis TaxID=2879643 RepID=UPI001EE817E0|nr:Hsp20/alpha crystallin family protein [Leptospira sanjuanensis]MCG6169888.1 Hsp20/alpha crystallin family protein [Leptospira sanjuanensis]